MPFETIANTVTSIDRSALHAAVAARLKAMIIEGALPPGARLNERVLCEQLDVSRTPLREAFKLLAGAGLIELQQNRGAVVARLALDDIDATLLTASRLRSSRVRSVSWPGL